MNGENNDKKTGPTLKALKGGDKGKKWALPNSGSVDVGRSSKCAITLSDKSTSKRHAVIENIDGLWFIKDLGSRHGTLVNKAKVDGKKGVFHGDRIRIGASELVFVDK